jgi:hypothetical protein
MYSACQVREDSAHFTHCKNTHTDPDSSDFDRFDADVEDIVTVFVVAFPLMDIVIFALVGIIITGIGSRLLLNAPRHLLRCHTFPSKFGM